jgi:plastocyanin
MSKKLAALAVAFAAAALAACAGQSGGGTSNVNGTSLPGMPDLVIKATLPDGSTNTISEELPGEGLGTINDPHWKATLGGFTQQQFSQALGFPPGTKITIMNISKSISHTLDVVKKIKKAPAKFPSNPSLPMNPSGGNFGKGYASGVLKPGTNVTTTLSKPGIYLFGCAFHYSEGMHDVIVVKTGATPGPQATPPAQ